MRTATTTLTSTNWASRTKTTKNIGAMIVFTQQFCAHSSDESQSSFSASYKPSTANQNVLQRILQSTNSQSQSFFSASYSPPTANQRVLQRVLQPTNSQSESPSARPTAQKTANQSVL